jgi:hypothetical protein
LNEKTNENDHRLIFITGKLMREYQMKRIAGITIFGLLVGLLTTVMVCAETVKFSTGE